MKKIFIVWTVFAAAFIAFPFGVEAQMKPAKLGKICGNPQVKCRTGDLVFQKHELAFEIPKSGNTVIVDSEPFYTVILKTVKFTNEVNCENAVSEDERLKIQKLFADHKVFALKCSEAGDVYYTNIAQDISFIAIYAGKTLTEAKSFLKVIKATGKFKGANARKMQATINGT